VQTLTVTTAHKTYEIALGANLFQAPATLELLTPFAKERNCLLITDSNVAPLYEKQVRDLLGKCGVRNLSSTAFKAGEASKTLESIGQLCSTAVGAGLDRRSLIIALGGGVVGDMAGFVAAVYMRGIPFIQIPTTLLAMVDSSVGGKVACDLPEGKNLIGAFHQPELVLANLDCLATLPQREIGCGLAEIAKYAVILDPELFELLECNAKVLQDANCSIYEKIVARCCELKAAIVREDETEQGCRAILNYGHTFGHALETLGGFSALNHGEGIAIGMGMAADLAVALNLAPADLPQRQDDLLRRLALPTSCTIPNIKSTDVLALMYHDKKVQQGSLRLVLPRAIGQVNIVACDQRAALLAAIGGRLE
jgi:3-dehydroquinate synthase